VRYLLRPFDLWWRHFPQLAALYLLGWLGRKGAIELAAYVGWDNDVWASLIMPFAGLARLGSYIAMFLVLRSAVPALAALPRRSARTVDVFANIIVPFFAIYLAWKLFAEDWLDFETAALNYRIGDAMTRALETGESSGLHPDQLPVSGATWVIIASALVLRYVLGKFKESLPGWVIAVRVYVDALWVFLTVSFAASQGASFLINPMGWIGERRIVVWANTTRAELFSHFRPLEALWDAALAVVRTAFGGFSHWRAGYAGTISSRPQGIVVKTGDGTASVRHVLIAHHRDCTGEQRFNVTWSLERTSGRWRATRLRGTALNTPTCR